MNDNTINADLYLVRVTLHKNQPINGQLGLQYTHF